MLSSESRWIRSADRQHNAEAIKSNLQFTDCMIAISRILLEFDWRDAGSHAR